MGRGGAPEPPGAERPIGVIGDADPSSRLRAKVHLARGAASAFVINVLTTGLAFITQILLARFLGPAGYGIYAYVMAWIAVLALCATLGFAPGMLRFVAAYRARAQWSLLRGVVRYALQRVGLAGLAVGGAAAGVVVALGDRLAPELARTLLVGCAMVPAVALMQVRSAIVRAFGGVVSALAPQSLLRHVVLLLVIAISGLVLSLKIEPHGALAAMLLATLVALGALTWSQRRLRPAELATAVIAYQTREWRRAVSILLLMAVIRALLSRADLLILGLLADPAAVGVYAVACRTSELVVFALAAINTIFTPNIAALYAQGDRAGLQTMVTATAWWASLSALVVGLPLFALSGLVLSVFGDAFGSGSLALRILLLGQLINATAGSVDPMLTMTGHERQAAVVLGGAAIGQVALSLALIPGFGAEGAAVANTVSLIGWNLAMAVLVWKKLKIVPSIFGRR